MNQSEEIFIARESRARWKVVGENEFEQKLCK